MVVGTGKFLLFPSLLLLLLLLSSVVSPNPVVVSTCPIDLNYVQTIPWNTSLCRGSSTADGGVQCCQSLLSLFGIGLAQHLKDTSMFQLPDSNSSSSCLSSLQSHLASLSVDPSLVSSCFRNSTQFVSNASSCAGIISTQDWINRVGKTTALDLSCNGDNTQELTWCSSCLDAGLRVTSQLVALDPNATIKCFYFTTLYAAGFVNELGPKDERTAACILGLPLSRSSTGGRGNIAGGGRGISSVIKLVSAVVGVALAVLVAVALAIFRCRQGRKRRQQHTVHQGVVNEARTRVRPNTGATWFGGAELERATAGFSQRNFIGSGGCGMVYKGVLKDGTQVAVKQLMDTEEDSKGDGEFVNEVEILSNIRHRNLLSLHGCCVASDDSSGKRRFLVYELMPNGSLHDHLFFGPNVDDKACSPSTSSSGSNHTKLSWPQRKNIVLDVARGLAYLHYGIKPAIYHRDIKATNILLDSEMRAKVADFGLAKQSKEGRSHLTTRVAGTHGYLAPEYALYGQLTEKSDVYSFGIVILEAMSGRKALDMSSATSCNVLITDWAWTLVKSGKGEEVLEGTIRREGAKGVMERFVRVGILCAHVLVAFRPTMAEALRMLEGDVDIPTLPDRPLPLGLGLGHGLGLSHHHPFPSSLPFDITAVISIADSIKEQSSSSSSTSTTAAWDTLI